MKNLRYALLTLTLVALSSSGLVAMHQALKPVELQELGRYFSGTLLDQIPQDLAPIVSVYKQALIVAKNALEAELKDCKDPFNLYASLEKLLQTYSSNMLVEPLEVYFKNNPELVCMEDEVGSTALLRALCKKKELVFGLLLDAAGQRVSELVFMQNKLGWTFLHLVVVSDNKVMATLLLKAAGEWAPELVFMEDYQGASALDFAEYYNNESMVQLLLQYS